MKAYHWLILAALFAVGYFVGAKYPSAANKVIGVIPSVST